MAQVQIRCPNSGLWASVGLTVDSTQWEELELRPEAARCGVCEESHLWSKADARLVDWAWSGGGARPGD